MQPRAFSYLVFSLVLVPAAARACEVDRFNFVWGSDTSSHIAVRSAESCRFGFRVNSRGHMDSVTLTQTPQHGTLSAVDATHWVYKAAHGYAGPDMIIVKASGNRMGNRHISSGDTSISWAVDVSP